MFFSPTHREWSVSLGHRTRPTVDSSCVPVPSPPYAHGLQMHRQAELNLLSDTAEKLVRGTVRPDVAGAALRNPMQSTLLNCVKEP